MVDLWFLECAAVMREGSYAKYRRRFGFEGVSTRYLSENY